MNDLPLLYVIRRRWTLVAATTFLAAAAAAIWSARQPELYEAAATVAIHTSDTSPSAPVVSVAHARALFESPVLAATVIAKRQLGREPESLTPAVFSERLTVTQAPDTNLLRVRLRLSSAAAAADTLAEFIDAARAMNRTSIDTATHAATAAIARQLEDAQAGVERSAAALLEYRREALIDVARRQAEAARGDAAPAAFAELYDREARLRQLEFEHSVAERVYREIVLRREEIKGLTLDKAFTITVAEPVAATDAPVSRRVLLSAAIGGAAGLMLALFVLALSTYFPGLGPAGAR
jgi:uncharacterized protein involved in exopolysaccharide biosynthesis